MEGEDYKSWRISFFPDDESPKTIDSDIFCSNADACEAFRRFLAAPPPPEFGYNSSSSRDIDNNLEIKFTVLLGRESPEVARRFISRIGSEIWEHIKIIEDGY